MATQPTTGIRLRRDNGWRIERYPQTVSPIDQDSSDVRNLMLAGALRVAIRSGLDAVDVDVVAEDAGVPADAARATFPDRDALLLELLDVVLARTLNAERDLAVADSGRLQLGDMLTAEMEGLRRQAPVVELIFAFYFARSDQLYRERIQQALATYRRAFESALAGVELRRGISVSATSSIVIAFLQGAAVQIIRDPDNFQPAAAIAEMRAMLH
jgi:AcrR family transcriptional regulator